MRILTNSLSGTARSIGRSLSSRYQPLPRNQIRCLSCYPESGVLRPGKGARWSVIPQQQQQQQRRGFLFKSKKKGGNDEVPKPHFPYVPMEWENGRPDPEPRMVKEPILAYDDLFHPFSKSPIPRIRAIGKRIMERAICPHNVKHEVGRHQLQFECPDCGIPVYCSKEHWQADYHNHILICEVLREINEDYHDLLSERDFIEFDFEGKSWDEDVINLLNWDLYAYTRQFHALDDPRQMRHFTQQMTYPITIGSVISHLSPYNMKNGRLTYEGLKSFAATRYTLHPAKTGANSFDIDSQKPLAPPMRIFVIGARAEASIPRTVWKELAEMIPDATFNVIFIGPEVYQNRPVSLPWPPPEKCPENPFGILRERIFHRINLQSISEYFHTVHKTGYWRPYDPYFDVFVLFHPGLGNPASADAWEETIPMLLETKCPIIATGFTDHDMERDVEWVKERCAGEFDILLKPGENIFKSLKWDLDERDPSAGLSQANWGVWAFRGKRYETAEYILNDDVIAL